MLYPQTSLRGCCLALCLRSESLSEHLTLFNHQTSFTTLNCQVPSKQAASHTRILQALSRFFSDRLSQAVANVSKHLCSKYFTSYFLFLQTCCRNMLQKHNRIELWNYIEAAISSGFLLLNWHKSSLQANSCLHELLHLTNIPCKESGILSSRALLK